MTERSIKYGTEVFEPDQVDRFERTNVLRDQVLISTRKSILKLRELRNLILKENNSTLQKEIIKAIESTKGNLEFANYCLGFGVNKSLKRDRDRKTTRKVIQSKNKVVQKKKKSVFKVSKTKAKI